MHARNINSTNKLKYVHLYTWVKNTTNKSTTQSQLVECIFKKIYMGSHQASVVLLLLWKQEASQDLINWYIGQIW